MIPGYAYKAMLVTGCLHCTLGVGAFVTAVVGLAMLPHLGTYYGMALFVSLWILLVGSLGISAGVKKLPHQEIRKLKTAYMVTAILSAAIFCWVESGMYALQWTGLSDINIFEVDRSFDTKVHFIRLAGGLITTMEFILAIVSSSICCCCSSTDETVYAYNTLPYQHPGEEELGNKPSASTLNAYPTEKLLKPTSVTRPIHLTNHFPAVIYTIEDSE